MVHLRPILRTLHIKHVAHQLQLPTWKDFIVMLTRQLTALLLSGTWTGSRQRLLQLAQSLCRLAQLLHNPPPAAL